MYFLKGFTLYLTYSNSCLIYIQAAVLGYMAYKTYQYLYRNRREPLTGHTDDITTVRTTQEWDEIYPAIKSDIEDFRVKYTFDLYTFQCIHIFANLINFSKFLGSRFCLSVCNQGQPAMSSISSSTCYLQRGVCAFTNEESLSRSRGPSKNSHRYTWR